MGSGNAGGGGDGVDGRPRFSWPFFLAALGVGAVLVGMVLALSQAPGPGDEPASSAGGGCSATPDVVTPSTGSTQWQRAWSFEAGEGKWGVEPGQNKGNLWNTYAHGDCLVVVSGWKAGEKTRLTGYRIAEDGPQRIWSIEEEHVNSPDENVWWGGKLVLGSQLLDPTTGALSDGPWDGHPRVLSDDFALACTTSSFTPLRDVCSGWDWNGGAPTKRWTQEYDGKPSVLTHQGIAGTTDRGAVLAELKTDLAASEMPIVAVSLADGSLLAEWPAVAFNQRGRYIGAADGWIHVAPEGAEASAVSLTGERTSFPLTGSTAALLVAEKGKPTIEQFRAAYETGDVSWARVVIDCPSRRQCSFNGNPSPLDLTNKMSGDVWDKARFQHMWSVSSDGRTLFMRFGGSGTSGAVDLVDIPSGKEIPLINDAAGRRTVTPIVRDDLVIAIEGSSLVGYRPR